MTKLAKVISVLFHPIQIPLYGILCFFFYSPFAWIPVTASYKCFVIASTHLYTAVFPALVVWWMKRVGVVSDFFVRDRKERTPLYAATIILYFAWFYSLWRLARMPHMAVAAALAIVLINLIVMLFNLRWKVSAHAAACGGVVGVITAISYLLYLNPVWLVCMSLVYSLVVMLARLLLEEHTPLQLIVGFFVGVGGAWMAYVISYSFLFV